MWIILPIRKRQTEITLWILRKNGLNASRSLATLSSLSLVLPPVFKSLIPNIKLFLSVSSYKFINNSVGIREEGVPLFRFIFSEFSLLKRILRIYDLFPDYSSSLGLVLIILIFWGAIPSSNFNSLGLLLKYKPSSLS